MWKSAMVRAGPFQIAGTDVHVRAEDGPGQALEDEREPERVEEHADDAVPAGPAVEGEVQHHPVKQPRYGPNRYQVDCDAGHERKVILLHDHRRADGSEHREVADRQVQHVADPEPHGQAGAEDPVDRTGGKSRSQQVEELAHAGPIVSC
jgi:hypothetical protein